MGHRQPEKYLLVKGSSGMGDRLKCLLTGLLYARLTGRHLLVDWSDAIYSPDGSNMVHSYFRSPAFDARDEIPETDSVRPAIWRRHLRDSALDMCRWYPPPVIADPHSWWRFAVDVRRTDYPEDVLVLWSVYDLIDSMRRHFRGEFAALRRLDTTTLMRQLWHACLELQPPLRACVDQFIASHFERPTLGVHVRYSDKKTRLSAIRQRVRTLLQTEPGLQIFVATDNRRVLELLQQEHRNVLSTPKPYPEPGIPMHGTASPHRSGLGSEALIDLYLLGACDYLIVDESSSFSFAARLLSGAEPGRVFNIQHVRWLPRRLRHLLWSAWIECRFAPLRLRARWRSAPQ